MADPEQTGRRVKLTGPRFADGRLPIDSLVELERYQQLLRLVARAEWEQDHQGESVPDDFDDDLSLTIERIEPGSADVFLAFEQRATFAEYQAQAQDAVSEVIAAAYEGRELPALPPLVEDQVRDEVSRFGSTLEAGQSIEVYVNGDDEPISVTVETRQKAVAHLALDSFWLAPLEAAPPSQLESQPEMLVGRITEVDAERSTYRFVSLQHGTVIGHFKNAPELLPDIRAVTDSETAGPVLRVEGDLQYRQGSPWRFKTTELVEVFTAGDETWAPRLVEFAQLETGWGEGGTGSAVAFMALDAAKTILKAVSDVQAPLPAVFPTEAGGVILEWATPDLVRNVEITPDAEFELFSMPTNAQGGTLRVVRQLSEAIAFAKGETS